MKSMRYVVIGIGKYGSRIALEMAGRGAEVFAIDCVCLLYTSDAADE